MTRPTRDHATSDLFACGAQQQADVCNGEGTTAGIPWDRRYGPKPGVRWKHAGKGFAPSPVRAHSVRQGHIPAIDPTSESLPEQIGLGDLAAPAVDAQALAGELQAYAGGRLTATLATLVLDTLRRRDTTKTALARAIGVEHPQIIRALNGSRGLSRSAAANLKRWLAA
ncbi:hypothetical protein SAMN02799631_00374 [Methylobacterium sp. 174MFSha1.1]|uniref:hypothetical protein n=1 Tax=Methylobacterium sp. 174MFSha1.1 TaxID=1502749 RepID=UPI0008E23064|nr:hypothetical protein [Methylobacterium sp. 174MFSha1.1]SFU38658.1 hypothetical protein SAMN02799631_00374 [Methylobacterium sp. 174MFSha1.1]